MNLNTIYMLCNTENDKIYIGQTWKGLKFRWRAGYRYCTKLQNAINYYSAKIFYYSAKLTEEKVKEIKLLLKYKEYNGLTMNEIGKKFGVNGSNIISIDKNKTWKIIKIDEINEEDYKKTLNFNTIKNTQYSSKNISLNGRFIKIK